MLQTICYGLLNLPLWGYFVTTLILTQITIAAVTLYLHRSQAHRAVDFHPVVSHFFRFWLWMTTGMVTKEWAAVHRKHHAKCETEEDPHSPQIFGLKKVLLEGAELYKKAAADKELLERYGHGTPDDWVERHVYTRYPIVGVSLMLGIDLLLFGLPGISIWGVQMLWIPLCAAGIINGIGHYFGYRNFECPDAAKNIIPFGLFVCGEELHNNHHTFATSAKLSNKWWELDLGWGYICALRFFKLAKVKRVAPKLESIKDKMSIDAETVKALITNRFQIMSNYSKTVILPVLQQEKQKAGARGLELFQKAKILLIREDSLVDADGRKRLAQLLQERKNLKQVYEYRLKLQAIWGRTTASQKELLEYIREWCRQAEATGIDALRDFAMQLRGFSVAKSVV